MLKDFNNWCITMAHTLPTAFCKGYAFCSPPCCWGVEWLFVGQNVIMPPIPHTLTLRRGGGFCSALEEFVFLLMIFTEVG